MQVDGWVYGVVVAAGWLLAGYAAAAEAAVAALSRQELRLNLGGRGARGQAEALSGEPARYLSTLLVVKLICYVVVTATCVLMTLRLWGVQWLPLAGLAVWLLLLLSQLLPRAWSVDRQEWVADKVAPGLRFLAWMLYPITAAMRFVSHRAVAEGTSPDSVFLSEGGLRLLLDSNDQEAIIEEDEKEMIASIFEFGETLVREVMVPRIDMVAVPMTATLIDALDVIVRAGHSRIPVYKDSIDNIAGILYAKDLLPYLREGRMDVPIAKILRSAYFIPESKKVDELLQELQLRRVHMAIVVDEYGGTAGLATIEDLLEEIVGEIQDEYDAEEPTIEAVDEDEYLFDARVALDEVNKLLDVDLPAEGTDSLGGFIYSQLGRVPVVTDVITYGGLRIEVLSVAGRRIKQVRASRIDGDEEPGTDAAGNNATSATGAH